MKKLIVIAVFSFIISGCVNINTAGIGGKLANEADTDYVSIIRVPEKSKDELYISVNSWLVNTFNSAESVIQFQDKSAGKVMGKYIFDHDIGTYYFRVKSTLDVDVKDGKVKIHFYNPSYAIVGDKLNGMYVRAVTYKDSINEANMKAARENWIQLETKLTSDLKTSVDW